jgi:myo-inositol 2-dehydrogenase/D-chiro-inositol 1-dehydrogenase
MIRIGLIGAGKIAERHVAAYKRLPDCEVIVADAIHGLARARSSDWAIQHRDDPWELIHEKDVDAVDICTPTPCHAPYTLAALEAGKHVFCEKPLCLSSSEAYAIKAAAIRNDRIVMVGYLYRFNPAVQFVKSTLDDGIIGDPYMAVIRLGGRGSAAVWKHQSQEGGGAVTEMMVHMLDLATWYFGSITDAVRLWHTTLLPERHINGSTVKTSAEDFVVIRMRAGNVQVLCESDLATPSYMQYVDIQGSNGSIFSSILHYMPTIVYCKEQRGILAQGNNIYTFPQVDLFEQELAHFLGVIRGTSPIPNDFDDSIRIVELAEQIRGMVADDIATMPA